MVIYMKRRKRLFDFSDFIILVGFGLFSYGIAAKYGIPDMCLVTGGLLVLGGLFFARAISRNGGK